jgi:hypothetical protein
MNIKLVVVSVFLISSIFAVSVSADQFYGGMALNPVSGQPDYEADGILNGTVGYETEKFGLAGWRFSYSMTNFKHADNSSSKIKSHILAAEVLFVAKVRSGLSLIGAAGPALFLTTTEAKNVNDSTALDIGLSTTGSLRFALSDAMFLEVALHYKNCAVSDDDFVVDGGYQGVFLNFGVFF